MDYNLAPQSLGVATMLYGSMMVKERDSKQEAKDKEKMEKANAKAPASKPMMVGDLRQNVALVAQKASAEIVGKMPGQPTQNFIVNKAVGAVGRYTGAMTVPRL